MRYEADHKERTHRRIVERASRQFRAEGMNGPGVAKLMKASGLTVGGFYKHFDSRDDLFAEAMDESVREMGEHCGIRNNAVVGRLRALESKGLIQLSGQSRAVRLPGVRFGRLRKPSSELLFNSG